MRVTALRMVALALALGSWGERSTCGAQAATPSSSASLAAILSSARARIEGIDVRASGRLVQVTADGKRISAAIAIDAHWFPDGLRMMVSTHSAANKDVRFSLTTDPHGGTSIVLLRPGQPPSVQLQPERWVDDLPGSIFSPEDFTEAQFLMTKQTLLPAQKYGARDCFVLKSEPGAGVRSLYRSTTTWIDQKTGAPVHVERLGRDGKQKDFVYYDLRQTEGVWAARQVEAKLHGSPGSSLLILERGSARAHLQRRDFDFSTTSQPSRSNP
jgi:hypothetical protein